MRALRRRYPQIYKSAEKLLIDPSTIVVAREDLVSAFRGTYSHGDSRYQLVGGDERSWVPEPHS